MTDLLKIYVYYRRSVIPEIRDEVTFRSAIEREISLVFSRFAVYKVILSPVDVLPYEESMQVVLEYDKTVNGRRMDLLVGQLLRILQADQLSTVEYKISVRSHRNILPYEEELKKRHSNLEVIDKITVERLKAIRKGQGASVVITILEYSSRTSHNPLIAELCKDVQGYRYMVVKLDKAKEKILEFLLSDHVDDTVAEHLRLGKGIVSYE